MHNKRWGKKLKVALSMVMTSLIIIPNISYAMNYEVSNNLKQTRSSLELNVSPIKEGIDINTDKEVSVIVEFKASPKAYATKVEKSSKFSANNKIDKEHEEFENFLNNLKSKNKSTYKSTQNIEYSYKNTFNGVALNIKGNDIEKLLECDVVKNIWPNEEVQLNLPKDINAKSNQEITPFMGNSKPHLGIDKLHEDGIKGDGIKVGVLDTGIDYNHPDLVDSYKGYKEDDKKMNEVKGWDFVDNDSDPMEATPEDMKESGMPEYHPEIGSSYYTSHGTHVSGTIAGTGKNTESEFATTGVAPEADLYVYRVLGPYGRGYTTDILAAIEKSVEDGMDVINLSLGANTNDPLYPTSVACNNAMLAGVTTILANGNSGPNMGTVGAPAASALSISVGASSVDMDVQMFDLSSGEIKENSNLLGRDFDTKLDSLNKEHELVYCGLGRYEDFANIEDLTGKIALIERGELSFHEKILGAKAKGAKAVIVYNNVDGPINVNLGENNQYVPTIGMTKENGNKLKEQVANGNNKITIKMDEVVKSQGDELADFSSRGPVIDGNIKPDVVAPGVSIMSTYPEFINHMEDGDDYSKAYARINGTSMAAPHVAGVAALIQEKNEDYDPFDVKAALMNTSDDLRHEYAVHEVGAGKIDPNQAVKSGISFKIIEDDKSLNESGEEIIINHETASLNFGNIVVSGDNIKSEKEILINNSTDKTNSFDVSVKYLSENKDKNLKDAKKNNVKLNVKKTAVASKNKETDLGVTLTIPKDAEYGMYQGYINLESRRDKNEKYQIPFSVNYTEAGIKSLSLDRNATTNELDWYHPFISPGLSMYVEMNEMVKRVDVLVRDFDTKKPIGYIGWLDGGVLTPSITHHINLFDPALSISPINDDNTIEPNLTTLKEGKYLLELVSKDANNKEDIKQVPFIVDNSPARVENLDKSGGVYEISEKDFTEEQDNNGDTHNAFWVHGKVNDSSIDILKDMGVNTSKESIKITSAINGRPSGPIFSVNKEGEYKFGVTKEDLGEDGMLEFRTFALNEATSLNHEMDQRYFFLEEGKPYLYSKFDKKEVNQGEDITTTLSLNNIKSTNKLLTTVEYQPGLKLKEVKLNDKAKEILDKNGYKAEIKYKTNSEGYFNTAEIEVLLKDNEGNLVEYSGDIDLVDVIFNVEDDREFSRYTMNVLCTSKNVYDKEGNKQEISQRLIYDGATIYQDSSDAYLMEPNEAIAFSPSRPQGAEKFVWVEDNTGNKYKVTYDDGNGVYISEDLPVSEEEFKVVAQAPGHFTREEKFVPSRNLDSKIVGKSTLIYGSIQSQAGDVNSDGVIDINDAIDLAKDYNKNVSDDKMKNKDFNLDNKIDSKDMDYIVQNFMSENTQDKDRPEPQESKEGKTLQDILNEIGYTKK